MLKYWQLQKGVFWGLIFGLKHFNQSDFQDGFNIPWILKINCRFKSEPVVFVFFSFQCIFCNCQRQHMMNFISVEDLFYNCEFCEFFRPGAIFTIHPKLFSSNQNVALYFCKEMSKSQESFVVELAILSTFFLVLLLLQQNKEMLKFWLFLRYCDKR